MTSEKRSAVVPRRYRGLVILLAASLLLLAAAFGLSAYRDRAAEPADERMRGVSFVAGPPVDSTHIATLRALHINWIAQTPFGWQARVDEPTFRIVTDGGIFWGERDSGLSETARLARAAGIHTLLKPHLWLRDRADGKWEGDIAMRNEEDWKKWFAQYERFLVHYAELAEAAGIEALCIGTELEGTSERESDWRRLIGRVRQIYSGQITYAANWSGEYERVRFWDALDFVGVQAYFPLSQEADPPLQQLLAGWRPHRDRLAAFAERVGKPIVFTEVGYRCAMGAAREPWMWRTRERENRALQARCYEAVFRTFWGEPWFHGTFWWKWYPNGTGAHPHEDAVFTPQGRPAEAVLASWYSGSSTTGDSPSVPATASP